MSRRDQWLEAVNAAKRDGQLRGRNVETVARAVAWFSDRRLTAPCTASYDTLAARAGCSRRTVQTMVRQLERRGFLVALTAGGIGPGGEGHTKTLRFLFRGRMVCSSGAAIPAPESSSRGMSSHG